MLKLSHCNTFLMLVFALLMSTASQAREGVFQLLLDNSESRLADSQEKAQVQRFFSDVEAKLPDAVKKVLGSNVRIGFSDIETDWPKRCQWNQIMGVRLGSVRGDRIVIERGFLPSILLGEDLSSKNGSGKNGCGYANAYRFAMATLLHQIAVRYDQLTGISNDPQISTLLGEAEIGGIFPARRVGEEISSRTPDTSEFESAQEGFAVSFERYAMDPEYFCRRPAVAYLFSTKMNWDPFSARKCQVNTVVPLSQEEINGNLVRFVNLDPRRLYQVHYLFASKGEVAMSRWGHSMYRLIFCAPTRKELGPDCLKDVSYHVVVSFRANVQDYAIDPLKGLNGDYPSQLYLLSMLEVMKEYNTDELRDLLSIPLRLSRDQVVAFLYRSLQIFWEYRGRYQFISNNCATEALNLLKSVVPDRTFQEDVHVVTPIGLYDELRGAEMMDDHVLDDLPRAKELGYFFPSENARLERAFSVISARSIPWTLNQYLSTSTAAQRIEWYLSQSQRIQPAEQGMLASQFFILESYLVHIHESEFLKEVARLLTSDDARKRLDPDGTVLKSIERAKAIEDSLSPQRLAPNGYGIALPSDYRPHLDQEIAAARAELVQLLATLKKVLEERFPERYHELLSTVENRKVFAKAMQQ